MTQSTTPAAPELERVRRIHYWLDKWQTKVDSAASFHVPDSDVIFSAEEVRAWPEVKAKLRDRGVGYDAVAVVFIGSSGQDASWSEVQVVGDGISSAPQCAEAIARGLCLYRAQLAPEPPKVECAACGSDQPVVHLDAVPEKDFPGGYLCGGCRHRSWADLEYRINSRARRSAPTPAATDESVTTYHDLNKLKPPAKATEPDPYKRHAKNPNGYSDTQIAGVMASRDAAFGPNNDPGNRARLVAHLTAELSQSTASRKARLVFPSEGRSCRVYRSNDR